MIVDYIPWTDNHSKMIISLMNISLEQTQKTLAVNVKLARQRVGLSQEKLALNADIDRTYVSQIERGISNPSLLILVKLANCLEISLVELMSEQTT